MCSDLFEGGCLCFLVPPCTPHWLQDLVFRCCQKSEMWTMPEGINFQLLPKQFEGSLYPAKTFSKRAYPAACASSELLRACLYIKRGPRCTYWPFSEFFRTLEHPKRCKIVVLLNAWFEKILGDETNLFSSTGKEEGFGLGEFTEYTSVQSLRFIFLL